MHLDVTPLCWVAPWPWPTFAADLPTDHNAEDWEEGFAKLVQYMEIEGDTRVSLRYQTDDGYNLGRWASVQRNTKDSMSQDRRKWLEKLSGWTWDLIAADWEEGYAKLTQYVEAEGHAGVTQRYKTDDGYKLGTWVSEQRQKKKKNKLSQDRQDRLEGLKGWVWEVIR